MSRYRTDTSVVVTAYVIVILGVILLCAPFVWFRAKMEADAYNRVTGENVSTWDAIWIELRVQGNPK